MTVREFYRNVLIELNKEEASALYVEDFLYYANKAVNFYVNSRYGMYDTSQQVADDLRALAMGPETVKDADGIIAAKAECVSLCNTRGEKCEDACTGTDDEIELCVAECKINKAACIHACAKRYPNTHDNLTALNHSYRHILNCIITVTLVRSASIGCNQSNGSTVQYACKRMTADRRSAIQNNSFLEPTFYRPYFKITGDRLEVLTGNSTSEFTVDDVSIEYLKNPGTLKIEAEDLLTIVDTTDVMEFDEYVCIELVNMAVGFILEQGTDPRLATQPSINQSIISTGGGNNK